MTLQEIAPYLPYGVKFRSFKGRLACMSVNGCYTTGHKSPFGNEISKSISFDTFCRNYKPILRPLSDLTKPCLEDGKIPIVELLKLEFNINPESLRVIGRTILTNNCILLNTERLVLKLDQFQKLFEWKFDVFGLIEKGEAIDINTLKAEQ